jgi:peptide chain release factor 2
MLIDDLRQQLKDAEPDIQTITAFWKNSGLENEYTRLNDLSNAEDFWRNPDQIAISKQLQSIKHNRETYQSIVGQYSDLPDMLTLFADDQQEIEKLAIEARRLCKQIKHFKVELLLNKPEDRLACYLNINSGAGGTESQDWASMLLRMYTRFCEQNNLKADVIDIQFGEEAGIKSATLYVTGQNACGLLKTEHGVHRLVRISPFDANKRRHTSFASVTIIPEFPEVDLPTIDTKDLRIDTYRAGGAGGQHVNKTESAVRITHIPTGIVVQCQNERSQIQNRETAMKMLRVRLAQKHKEEQEAKTAGIERKKIEWGSQIRSYVLHPYKMIKDHRTDFESPQPDLVLDGDLMEFIEKSLVQNSKQ